MIRKLVPLLGRGNSSDVWREKGALAIVGLFLLLGVAVGRGFSVTPAIGAPMQLNWVEALPSPSRAIARHQAVVVSGVDGEQLCIIGGRSGRGDSSEVYCYPINEDGTLEEGDHSPAYLLDRARYYHRSVSINGRVYTLGGMEGNTVLDTVHCAWYEGGTWHNGGVIGVIGRLPGPRAQFAAVAMGTRIYVIGGIDGRFRYTNAVYSIDVGVRCDDWDDSRWRQEAASLPEPLSGHASVAVSLDGGERYIYVIGGIGPSGVPTNKVWKARVENDGALSTWQDLGSVQDMSDMSDMPEMWLLSAAVSGRYLYVLGGTNSPHAENALDVMYRAHIEDDGSLTWLASPGQLPFPLRDHAVAVSGAGRLYVVGGRSQDQVRSEIYFTPLLSFSKTVSRGDVAYGDVVDYALELTNLGVRDLGSLTITDTVSSPVSVTPQSLPDGCQSSGHAPLTITCTIPGLSLGESRFLTYSLRLSPPAVASSVTRPAFTTERVGPSPSARIMQPAQVADLSIEKDGAPVVVAGRLLTYTLRIRNELGLGSAQNVVVTDELPDGMTFVRATPSPDSVDPLRWSLGEIPTQAEREITLVVQVDPGSSGTLVNRATVSSDSWDPDSSDNQDEEQTAVVQQADLSIKKTDHPDPVMAGGLLTYTLTITNAGPSDARGITVTDFLPTELQVISTTPVTTSGPSPLEWRLDLPAGQSAEIQILASVAPNSTGTLQNIAMVSSDIDPSSGNNTAQEWTAIGSQADLRLQKVDEPDPVSPGGVLTYTLLITNEGPSEAINVVVTDTLPAEICQVNSQPAGCSGDPLVCDLGTMAAGATRKLQITATVCLTATGLLVNEAEVNSDVPDSDPTSNQAQASTATEPVADLRLTKSRETEVVIAGDVVTYVLRVTNEGPSIASDVVVSDWLPVNTTFVTATQPVTVQHGVTTATWYTPTLRPGQSWGLYLVVRTPPGSNGVMTNTARVASKTLDDYSENNSAVDTAYVYGLANLSISKVGYPNPVDPGGVLTYTLWITNAGPSEALNVVVTDTLPPGICGWNGLPANCSGNPLVCTLGTIPAGEARSFSLSVTVCPTSTGKLVNEAGVGSGIPDSDSTDNQVQEETAIGSRADLQITKNHSPMTATAGTLLTYTLVVTNHGPSVAQSVVVTEIVPFNTHLITVGPGSVVTSTSPFTRVIWSTPSLSPSRSVQFWMVVLADPGAVVSGIHNVLTNTAVVASSTPDDDLEDNEVLDWAIVQAQADLVLEKESSAGRVPRGGILRYLLRIGNKGPSDAREVVVTDTLPVGLSFLSSAPSPLDVAPAVWHRDRLRAGETWTIPITTVVNAQPGAILTNTACVDSATPSTLPLPACDETRAFVPAVVQNQARVCEGGRWCKASNLSAVLINPLRVYLPVLLRNNR